MCGAVGVDEEKLQALAKSIEKDGLLQPIIVIENRGATILVAGERWYKKGRCNYER